MVYTGIILVYTTSGFDILSILSALLKARVGIASNSVLSSWLMHARKHMQAQCMCAKAPHARTTRSHTLLLLVSNNL